jgi:hypothetical protein
VDISDKRGQYFNITHDLNYGDVLVDIIGRAPDGSEHQKYLGLSKYEVPGWVWAIGGSGSDIGRAVVQTSDGGYAIAGNTNSFDAGNNDVYLVKTDSAGNMLWSFTYGGTGIDMGYSVIQTIDGGYAITGYTNSFGAGLNDVYLVKADANGNMLWNMTYGGGGIDVGRAVVQKGDGGYDIAGYTNSSGAGNSDVYLVKTDSAGSLLWSSTYGGAGSDLGHSLVQTVDGGYAVAGQTASFGAGGNDIYLVRTDSSGGMLWNQTYGGTGSDVGMSLVQSIDGGFAMTGPTTSFGAGGTDVYFVETDGSGKMLRSTTFGGPGDDYDGSMTQSVDGSYVIAGYTDSFGSGLNDVYLVKTDTEYEFGLARTGSTDTTLTLYRGSNDVDWTYVRVRIWKID